MNTAALYQQVQNDCSKKDSIKEVALAVRQPLLNLSRQIWGYSGKAGLLTPWHDDLTYGYNFYYKQVYSFVQYLQKEDISLITYSAFVFPVMDYTKYERISLLVSGKGERSWMKKLRAHAGSKELLDEVASLFFQFLQIQVEINGKCEIHRSKVVAADVSNGGKYFEGYHRLVDRVKQLKDQGIDPLVWAKEKARRHVQFYPGESFHFRALLNMNGLEPNVYELQRQTNDEWRTIRGFLGVSPDCEFIDNLIPKGWSTASDDRQDLTKIVRIDKDGYYWYANGEQHKGKRHYVQNAYWVIGCTPDNFDMFRDSWNDVRLISKAPTWDEYARWGVYQHLWGESGESLNGRGRSIKWRKR